MISVSHPTGNTFVRALLKELDDRKEMGLFFTTIGCGHDSLLRRPLQRRSYPIPTRKVITHSWPELKRLIGSRLPFGAARRNAPVDWIYRKLDQWVADRLPKSETTVIHCYEDGARETFKIASELGIHRSYELPIAHHATLRRLLQKEAERWPAWEPTLLATTEPEEKLQRKDKELELADAISCPSQFVLDTLPSQLRKEKPCYVSPFGTPTPSPTTKTGQNRHANEPVRFLFAGSMSQRKGLADLFDAFRQLKTQNAELHILGAPMMPMDFYRSQGVEFIHHPPCSHQRVLTQMGQCDVLVLPSIVEGRALVQQEAMSQGLPILVTRNAGGEDLVQEKKTGILVEPSSPNLLAEKMEWFIRHKNQLPSMKKAAQELAASYSWAAYAKTIMENGFSVERKILGG